MDRKTSSIEVLSSDCGDFITYARSLLISFWIFAIGLSLSFGCVALLKHNENTMSFFGILCLGFVASTLLLLFVISLDVLQKTVNYFRYRVVVLSVRPNKVLGLNASSKDVYVLMYNVLNDCKKIRTISHDTRDLSIQAKTKRSWRSFGEYIDVKVEDYSPGKTIVKIYSKPVLTFTVVDYCKNFENIEMIIRKMKIEIQKLGFGEG